MKTVAFLLAGLVVGAAGCSSTPSSAPTPEKETGGSILGTWELVSAEENGKPSDLGAPDPMWRWNKLVVEDYKFSYRSPQGKQELPLKLNPKKDPAEYDLEIVNRKGIYKIEGDKLFLCESKTDEKRPTEFSSKPGTSHLYMVLKRIKD